MEHLKAEAPSLIQRAIARGEATLPDPNRHVSIARAQRTKRAIKRKDTTSPYYIPPFIKSLEQIRSS
jgi:hypothetical protein